MGKRELAKAVPAGIPQAIKALDAAQRAVRDAKTYDRLLEIERWVDAIRVYWRQVEEVRQLAERVLIFSAWHAGKRALASGNSDGRPRKPLTQEAVFKPTLQEMFGSRTRGSRLKRLAKLGGDEQRIEQAVSELHGVQKEATLSAVLRLFADELSAARRARSRAAKPLLEGMELRIGDSREMLADVPDNSVPL